MRYNMYMCVISYFNKKNSVFLSFSSMLWIKGFWLKIFYNTESMLIIYKNNLPTYFFIKTKIERKRYMEAHIPNCRMLIFATLDFLLQFILKQ